MSHVDEERARILGLVKAKDRQFRLVDDRDFLIYCIENCYSASDVPRARELYDQLNFDPDVEDMM